MSVISEASAAKMPSLAQMAFVPTKGAAANFDIEMASMKTLAVISNIALRDNILINASSLSSQSVTYKGMIRPAQIREFYACDLQDPHFTTTAVQIHAKMATNTDPQWANAQPCPFFLAHNGELNSAKASAHDMANDPFVRSGNGRAPDAILSDSILFDGDLANHIIQGMSLEEAFIKLMNPDPRNILDSELRAMLDYNSLLRTPYNGPAFMATGHDGTFIARIDTVGLRPARFSLVKNADGSIEFKTHSDDVVNHENLVAGQKVIKKSMIEPGGIVTIDKDGKLLRTEEVLRKVHEQVIYRAQDVGEEPSYKYFQDKLDRLLIEKKQIPLADASAEVSGVKKAKSDLNRALHASYWDADSVTDVLFPAAYLDKEALGAMSNDIDPLPKLTGVDGDVFDAHITTFFCQLFAQVSNPPIDSIRERQSFNLRVNLGAIVRHDDAKNISFSSPIFTPQDLAKTKSQGEVAIHEIDTTFDIEPGKGNSTEERQAILQEAIKRVLAEVMIFAHDDTKSIAEKASAEDMDILPDGDEKDFYKGAIKEALENHTRLTNSTKGRKILAEFDREFTNFKVAIPKALKEALKFAAKR